MSSLMLWNDVFGLIAAAALLMVLRPIRREIRTSSLHRIRVLLVGRGPLAERLIDEIESCPARGYTVIGRVEETPDFPQFSTYLILGTISDLRTVVRAVKPDRIVLALADRRGRMPADELLEFQTDGIVVQDVAEAYEEFSGKLAIETITPGQLIASQCLLKPRALRKAQRVISFVAAAFLLVALAPILGIIALAIQINSGRPILFRQFRLGKAGRPFSLIKFRTMRPVERPTTEWADDNVDRITRVGKWLRRLRLDELPQLINVLRGDMNLVGPRPHPVSNVTLFREAIPYYVLRCSVLPGITGWAQTRYCYANNLEQETEKMRYDLYYIKHMSLWLDLRIVLSTALLFVRSSLGMRHERQPAPQVVLPPDSARLPIGRRAEAFAPMLASEPPHLQLIGDADRL